MSTYYSSAEGSSAEVDFVVNRSGKVVPVEAKAAENFQAKRLK